ncbi:MAG TPA: alpha/beta hydrolase [Hyphomicrobiales bacterium]|nr:alpha/beta hydrolase [Hyphomicrobiales bacterium]
MTWETMSRAERDAAYNNAAAVADSAEIVGSWEGASEALRRAHPGHLALPYGEKARNKWDLFPSSNPSAPCLIHIHGGYWQMRSKDTFSCLAEGVAANDWSVALPGYTLAPEASLTQIIAELRAALDWFARYRGDHGVRGPLILSGWSAGGHLTAMLLDHPSISAGLAISGIYELGPLRDTYINDKLRLSDSEIASLSPLRLMPAAKPLAIAYGTRELDALVLTSRDYHARRASNHLPGNLVPVAGADHFTILETLRKPDGVLTKTALRLAEDIGAG